MSTADVIDTAASLQNVTLPPIDASPANDVESNDVEGGPSTENVKKKRNRRKPHGNKSADVKKVENESKEIVVDEGIATDEPLEQKGGEEKAKRKRNRKKPTNPKSAEANKVDGADQVDESQQEGKTNTPTLMSICIFKRQTNLSLLMV